MMNGLKWSLNLERRLRRREGWNKQYMYLMKRGGFGLICSFLTGFG